MYVDTSFIYLTVIDNFLREHEGGSPLKLAERKHEVTLSVPSAHAKKRYTVA